MYPTGYFHKYKGQHDSSSGRAAAGGAGGARGPIKWRAARFSRGVIFWAIAGENSKKIDFHFYIWSDDRGPGPLSSVKIWKKYF